MIVRLVAVCTAAHRQHHDIVSPDAISDVHLFDPIGGDQDQWQGIQHVAMFRDITIGHEPRHGLHPKLVRMQDQIWKVAPEPHADHNIRLEPTKVPFLFKV
jgi:hypothetical protein